MPSRPYSVIELVGAAIAAAVGGWIGAGLVAMSRDPALSYVRIGAACLGLRPSTLDWWIYNEVVAQDSYRLRTTPLPPNPIIVDIGAQVGIFTAFAAAVYPTARIFSYEMDDLNFAALRRNVSTLADRVTVERAMVVGSHVPSGYSRDAHNSGGHHVGGPLPAPPPITLAGIIAEHAIPRIDLLKIDIEGSEYDVLGLAVTDGSIQRVDRIYGEWHDGRVGDLASLLAPYFNVETTNSGNGVGMFFATRLAGASASDGATTG